MSNFLAIATVTATLRQLIQHGAQADVSGADVTMLRPHQSESSGEKPRVNIYLYQVTPNAAWRNSDLPTRRANGQLVQQPRAAIDLHYLLTFYGDESQLEPQRLLGSTVRTLHAKPVLTRELVRATIPSFSFLGNSNLADDVELVKFTPLPLSLEELSKLWSVFLQTPYTLSLAYQGTVILIESEETPHPALPVREQMVYVKTFLHPFIEQAVSQAGAGIPITAGGTLLIKGKQLKGDSTRVRFGNVIVGPAPMDVTDAEIVVALPSTLRSGVHGVQIVHEILMGKPAMPHTGVESNMAAFVLSPTIIKRSDGSYDVTVSGATTASDGSISATVTVKISPNVGLGQRTTLLLNELDPTGERHRAYSFSNPPLVVTGSEKETDTIKFRVSKVAKVEYMVRVRVDGAESPFEPEMTTHALRDGGP